MSLPITINRNTLKTFNNYDANRKVANSVQSDNLFDWRKDIPNTLQEICLEEIAKNWEANPLLDEIPQIIDRCFLLNILSTQLPLKITVPKIEDDIYWKRCYLERWPKCLPRNISVEFHISEIVKVNHTLRKNSNTNSISSQRSRQSSLNQKSNGSRWKECFLETHVREYLEKLKPEDYDAEKIKELADLCGMYVKILNLRELQCAENSPNRIPLNAILTGLVNLTELSICFKQIYVGEKFSWNILSVHLHDIKLLAKGLEKCNLKIFRLKNSDVDDEKVILLLKSLLKHDELQTLDFSHCRISDEGCIALSNFCMQNPVNELILANNKIGAKGVQALCYAICRSACNLKILDLKLNPIGNEGLNHLLKPLTMGVRNIKKLILNGCGIGYVSSIGEMIEHNSSLEYLNLSNNSLGEEMGKIILQGLRYNITLTSLDVRMCKLHWEDEFDILKRINKNKITKRRPSAKKKPIIIEPQYNFEIPDDLLANIENSLQKSDMTLTHSDSELAIE